jgi:large subunit ribosomal protein L35
MSKMKTHKGAAKRFKKNGSGRIKSARAGASHGLRKKNRKLKRNLKGRDYKRSPADVAAVKEMLA